jgi:hypothetical protein
VYAIEQWVHDSYGLLLHTDRPAWRLISIAGLRAAAHAAGFIAALDMTNCELIAQLAPDGRGPIDSPVRWLAAARDAAWQAITAVAAQAHHLGCTSLPTGPSLNWAPVCVSNTEIGPKCYPALATDTEPAAPPRFTRTTAQRIGDDLAGQHARRIIVRFPGPLITVTHADQPSRQPNQYQPDDDGLYALGAGSLDWHRVR